MLFVSRIIAMCLMLSLAGSVFANGGSGYEALLSITHVGDDCRDIPDDEHMVSIFAHHSTRRLTAEVWFFSAVETLFSFRIEGDKVFWPADTSSTEPDGKVIIDGKNGTVVDYRIGNYAHLRVAFILADNGSMTIVGEQQLINKDCVMNFIGTAD